MRERVHSGSLTETSNGDAKGLLAFEQNSDSLMVPNHNYKPQFFREHFSGGLSTLDQIGSIDLIIVS